MEVRQKIGIDAKMKRKIVQERLLRRKPQYKVLRCRFWGVLGPLGRSWEALGMLLGALGALLGRSWGDLGCFGGPLGAVLGHVGCSWALLERFGVLLDRFLVDLELGRAG